MFPPPICEPVMESEAFGFHLTWCILRALVRMK
jgi:hypothetical protein